MTTRTDNSNNSKLIGDGWFEVDHPTAGAKEEKSGAIPPARTALSTIAQFFSAISKAPPVRTKAQESKPDEKLEDMPPPRMAFSAIQKAEESKSDISTCAVDESGSPRTQEVEEKDPQPLLDRRLPDIFTRCCGCCFPKTKI